MLFRPLLQVLAGTARLRPRIVIVRPVRVAHADARRQCSLTHVFELGAGRHLLGEQGRLDAVEQSFEPPHQLRLRDAEFGVGGDGVVGEGQGEALELVAQFGARPCSSSWIDDLWISFNLLRLASSSGAARTSSRSCLIIVPMRMTLAGCSTMSATDSVPLPFASAADSEPSGLVAASATGMAMG